MTEGKPMTIRDEFERWAECALNGPFSPIEVACMWDAWQVAVRKEREACERLCRDLAQDFAVAHPRQQAAFEAAYSCQIAIRNRDEGQG